MNALVITSEEQIRQQAAKDGVTHFATGVAVFKNGRLLVVRRDISNSFGGHYELPGGKVDQGETIEQSAIRELYEETGLRVAKVLRVFSGMDYTTQTKPKVRQINFLAEAEAANVTLSHEHDHYRWITQDDIAGLVTTDEVKSCLRQVFAF